MMDLVQSAVSTNKSNTNRYKVLIGELQKLIFVPFSMQNNWLFSEAQTKKMRLM